LEQDEFDECVRSSHRVTQRTASPVFVQLQFFGHTRCSKANADAQLHLVPLEIVEIERARGSRHRAPDLNVPRRAETKYLSPNVA
jgi:hypothetical protein